MKELKIIFTKNYGRKNILSEAAHEAIIAIPKDKTQGEVIDSYKQQNFGKKAMEWVITHHELIAY